MLDMKRREFIALKGPRAQQPSIPVIGFLINGAPDVYAEPLAVPRPEDQYRLCGVTGKGCVSEEI